MGTLKGTLLLPCCCLLTVNKFSFLIFPVPIAFLIITLPLGALGYFCVHRRKRKRSQPSPEGMLTIYAEINVPIRRNQEQQQSPGEGSIIDSRIQSQPSASTTPKTENTLYSLVQPSRSFQSGSKKRNHSSSFISTVYEEVGKRQPKAQHPERLSQKELENFCAYS